MNTKLLITLMFALAIAVVMGQSDKFVVCFSLSYVCQRGKQSLFQKVVKKSVYWILNKVTFSCS